MPKTIADIAKELFAEKPTKPLYHYTSLAGLQGIIDSRSLRVSDIRFFNDAAEVSYASGRLRDVMRGVGTTSFKGALIAALMEGTPFLDFVDWLPKRLQDAAGVYVGSFTEEGNLLSQWRGYCPPSKGVSLGFKGDLLLESAQQQRFAIGKCIYDKTRQDALLLDVADALRDIAPPDLQNEEFTYLSAMIEADVLQILALLKHPSFAEEQEWRVVSPVHTSYVEPPIKYREGKSMLIPYLEFNLPVTADGAVALKHVYLGPTPHVNLSLLSLSNCLAKAHVNPPISYCNIPLRES